jgi:hypothetical protein
MAAAACDQCGQNRGSRLSTFYPALVADGKRHSKKRHLCSEHARDSIAKHAKDWRDKALVDADPPGSTCLACGEVQPVSAALTPFYCTLYLDGKYRRDYQSQYCAACVGTIVSEFEIDV